LKSLKKKKKLLILGGSSLLAYLWVKEVNNIYEIYITKHKYCINYMGLEAIDIDLFSRNSVRGILESYDIDIVVNCIGLTNVETCEKDPDTAFRLNSHLPGIIANACNLTNTKLIHISTDHFFDNQSVLYSEEDEVRLINVYAKSKYEGELEVLTNCQSSIICRTNFFGYGPDHKNSFSEWIEQSAKNNQKIVLFKDVFITPVSGNNLAFYAHKLLDKNCSGIFNISSDKQISKFDFGKLLCNKLNIPSYSILPGSIDDRSDLVRRPKSMGLSNSKLTRTIKNQNLDIETQIGSILKTDQHICL
tara:strand:+ start:435 stop:1346 length:912 start_codon:yes stop_codon:yes gene_type:complete